MDDTSKEIQAVKDRMKQNQEKLQKVGEENKVAADAKFDKMDKQEEENQKQFEKLSDADKETLQKIEALGEESNKKLQ